MVVSCWVKGCTNRASRQIKRSFYYIPKIRVHEGDQTYELSKERRQIWLENIGRKENPTMASRICSDHFVSGKPSALYDRANVDWAPTLQLTDAKPKRKTKQVKETTRKPKAFHVHLKLEVEVEDAARALLILSESGGYPAPVQGGQTSGLS